MNRILTIGRKAIRRQAADALDIIFPPFCGICGKPALSDDRLICDNCRNSIEELEAPYCLECRQFLPDHHRCPYCAEATLTVYSLGYFDSSLRTILHDLKFNGLKPLGKMLGAGLAAMITSQAQRPKFDLIVPVPLHRTRELLRGYNQAEVIADEISRILDVPIRPDLLFMTRRTRQQARLSAARREANIKGAYAVYDQASVLKKATILLVDDVTTTGATLRENARALMSASAGRVIAAVVATVA